MALRLRTISLYGILQEHLSETLLWTRASERMQEIEGIGLIPSWSWQRLSGTITFITLPAALHKDTIKFTFEEHSPEPKLEGKLWVARDITVGPSVEGSPAYLSVQGSRGGGGGGRVIFDQDAEPPKVLMMLRLRSGPATVHGADITTGTETDVDMSIGLLVELVAGARRNYKRVGVGIIDSALLVVEEEGQVLVE